MWTIELSRGSAAEFHARPLPEVVEPAVWWFDVLASALVIGSAQPIEHVDLQACARTGIDVVRRRSGGGAVLLQPGDAMWVDVVLPRTDPRWTDDVGQSAWWLGEVWQRALTSLGTGGIDVHRTRMTTSTWSSRVCFAGVGGGEVIRTADGAKVVGISQRRTRDAARFQCALYRHWRPEAHVGLFSPPAPTVADLSGLAVPLAATPEDIRAAFAAALVDR